MKAVASASRGEAGGGVGKQAGVVSRKVGDTRPSHVMAGGGGADGGDGGEKATRTGGGSAGREVERK